MLLYLAEPCNLHHFSLLSSPLFLQNAPRLFVFYLVAKLTHFSTSHFAYYIFSSASIIACLISLWASEWASTSLSSYITRFYYFFSKNIHQFSFSLLTNFLVDIHVCQTQSKSYRSCIITISYNRNYIWHQIEREY